MARLAVYGAISTVLAGGVIASAFAQRSNFYAACIYLYRSNACMMIILNLGLFLTIIAGQLVQIIFFGNLRTLEVEHLYERAWYAVTETCLAMTIFKDEFDTRFVVMFTVLLFLKVFHWLCMDRVDSMEQSPEIPLSFHVRMVTMIAMLVSLDVLLVFHAVNMVKLRGPNMMIMFGFEYTLLATSLMASFGKYILHTIDMRSEEPWENKSMLLFYLDLVADFVKLVTYLLFFMVILVCYGLPLHIIRDVYMTMRSFLQKCKDLIQYRKATRNMNERYPDASPAELEALSDPICIICREEMVGTHHHAAAAAAGQGIDGAQPPAVPAGAARPAAPRASGSNTNVPKKLPCGHIFHFHCLKSWLERQQSCPTCRRLVLDPPTPAPTPVPAAGVDAAGQGAGGAPAAVPGAGQPGAIPGGFGNFGNNNLQAPGAAHGAVNPGFLPNHGMGGYPLFAPQGHYPLAGWHPQHVMAGAGGGLPGAIPQAAAGNGTTPTMTGAAAGTGANGAAAAPLGPHANYIPHYSIPNVMHPIPGFIPLFPVGGPVPGMGVAAGAGHPQNPQQQEQHGSGPIYGGDSSSQRAVTSLSSSAAPSSASPASTKTSAATLMDQIPLTPLDTLSEDQLKFLEENTRRGLQERLRVLQAVESQIAQSVNALNRVLGVLPPESTPFRSECADPPSPSMPASTAASASESSGASSTSAMNRMFGGASVGSSASASSTSQLGLLRGGLDRTLSNGTAGKNDTPVVASSTATKATLPVESSPPSSTLPPQAETAAPTSAASSTTLSAGAQADSAQQDNVATSTTGSSPSQGSLNGGVRHFEGGLDVPLEVGSLGTDGSGNLYQHRVEKGKAKKTDAEIEQESLADQSGARHEQAEEDEDEEDAKYSPQEMVRRRWARVNASPPLE